MDFEAGARVAGHGFYFLKNEAVLLELALSRYALEVLLGEGFTPMITPDLARNDVLEGIGFIPRGPETQIYSIERSDLSLVATAEITLGGLMAGQTIDAESLPLKLCGISHCFRTEAGATAGPPADCSASTSSPRSRCSPTRCRTAATRCWIIFAAWSAGCSTAWACPIAWWTRRPATWAGRPIASSTSRRGCPAAASEFGEVTSTSNCTDYQARRLNIRYKVKGEKGTHLVHTLNGTAIAVSRALIAIMENYQQADGSIVIPEVLRGVCGERPDRGEEGKNEPAA